ncbi:MAG: spermidine synthase [Desulfobacteraceae bacterium Eth-SRB1]|nr:MAG: spermidine synthase [Desulfobacteraceae bacterium Eth-SRB1]
MKKTGEKAVILVVIATGISSVVTQLLIIREFLAQLQGNEFVIALILFSWLITGGIGTLLARLVARRLWRPTACRLGWLSFCLAFLPALQILVIRRLRDILFIHGSSIGFYPVLGYIFFTVAPYCLLVGFVLPYSLFLFRVEDPDYPGTRIYMTDNLGDVAGGALFSFILVYLFSPLQAVFLGNLPLVAASCFLFVSIRRMHPAAFIGAGLALVILLSGIYFEPATLVPREGELVHYKESRYGRISVHKDREQYTLFIDGTPVFSSQNLNMAEEAIHYPLSQVSDPENILLISAEGGMMTELQKYRPAGVDYVELDPEVSHVLFRFGLIKNIPGLNVINQDARAYLAGSDKIYDAIIVNLPEPETFQINRFFTGRFFELARTHLALHGVFGFSVQGFDNYLAEPQRRKISSLYNTVSDHFKHVLLLPGERIFFLCSDNPINIDIPACLEKKGIPTSYISGFFYGNLTHERIVGLNNMIDPSTPENIDEFPQLIRLMFLQWFAKFSTSPYGFIAGLTVLLIIYLVRIAREEFVLFSTGFMAMGSEILVIFAFQIFFGYIYFQIGLIVTVFLAGLLPGAWFGERMRGRGRLMLALTDGLLIILIALFMIAVKQYGDRLPVAVFLIFGFVVSLTCGCQFPVALRLRGGDNPAATRAFSADLIGAAFGTLITSVALIPCFGIIWTAAGLIGLKLTSIIVIATGYEKNK